MAETKTTGVQGVGAGQTARALAGFPRPDLRRALETTTPDRAHMALLFHDAFCNPDVLASPSAWNNYLRLSGSERWPVLAILLRDCSLSGSVFSSDNPIHDFLGIESEMGNAQLIRNTYRTVGEILAKVKKSLPSSSYPKTAEKAQAYLKAVYEEIKAAGIKVGSEDGVPFFHRGIADKILDCDTSTMVVLAIAHEMKWPVYPVFVPGHVFARWDDGAGTRFNIDHGSIDDDDYYMTWPQNISKESVDEGLYLKNLTRGEMKAIMYATRASAKDELGRHEEAIADYDKAIELDPKYAIAYGARAIAKGKLGRHQDAIDDYDKVIELDPKYVNAYYNRAIFKSKLGRHQDAIDDYDKAIELNPKHASAYFSRAIAKGELGRHQEAIDDYDKAIELDPKHTSAYYGRAIAKDELGRHEEALDDYEEYIWLSPLPDKVKGIIGRGNAKEKLGLHEEAIAHYDRALELDPNSASAYYRRALSKSALGKKEDAVADFDKAFELKPDDISAFFNSWFEHVVGEYPFLANIAGYDMTGDKTTLFLNGARGDMNGTHVALINTSLESMDGKQSAFGNIATKGMVGVQLAVIMNGVIRGGMKGVQVGLVNAAMGGDMKGLQIGAINMAPAGDMEGIQIGAINYAGGKMESTWGILNLSARCNFYVADPFGGDTCVFGQKEG